MAQRGAAQPVPGPRVNLDTIGPVLLLGTPSGGALEVWPALAAIAAHQLGTDGVPVGAAVTLVERPAGTEITDVAAAVDGSGGFLLGWCERLASTESCFAGRFGPGEAPIAPDLQVSADGKSGRLPAVACNAMGECAMTWFEGDPEFFDNIRPRALRFDPTGRPRGAAFQPYPVSFDPAFSPLRLALDLSGTLALAVPSAEGNDALGVLRFDGENRRLGEPIVLPAFTTSADLAFDSLGRLLIAWSTLVPQDPNGSETWIRVVDPGGGATGVDQRVAHSWWAWTRALVADSQGGFLLTGQVSVQRLTPDGRTAGGPLLIDSADSIDQATPVAGGFVLHVRGGGTQIFRWPPPGAEACALDDQLTLRCDGAHTGGPPDLTTSLVLPVAAAPGDIALLGDVDGNGQADLCLYHSGTFFCATDHSDPNSYPYPSPVSLPFGGRPGDVPLIGDVDGDGIPDLCVRRGRRFLCDTAHNGGSAEWKVSFGLASDIALLGDVDGNGTADPCVYRNGLFLCDTAHDGGLPEVVIAFGQPGDVPFLADADGDGRADPCVLRASVFYCDIHHDGGSTVVTRSV